AVAFDPLGELAERAERPRRDLAAGRALQELDVLHALERRARLFEKPEQKVLLGARRRFLEPVQKLLVADRCRALGERALLDDVIDPAQERIAGRLALGQPVHALAT